MSAPVIRFVGTERDRVTGALLPVEVVATLPKGSSTQTTTGGPPTGNGLVFPPNWLVAGGSVVNTNFEPAAGEITKELLEVGPSVGAVLVAFSM